MKAAVTVDVGNLPLSLCLVALFAAHYDKNSMSLHEHEREKLSVTVNVGNLRLVFFLVALFGGRTMAITACLCMNMSFGGDLYEIFFNIFMCNHLNLTQSLTHTFLPPIACIFQQHRSIILQLKVWI